MRVAWLTDLHLNFLRRAELEVFYARLEATEADAFLIGGDVGEAPSVVDYLQRIDEAVRRPVYFVLGNHDFYHGSIHGVRRAIGDLCRRRQRLHYLTTASAVPLSAGVALIGHDGWADARIGDYQRSEVMLNDYRLIAELANLWKDARRPVLEALGDAAAASVRQSLTEALSLAERVMLLTHVPPWREAAWHEGRHSDDEWAPHFTCQAVGEAVEAIMRAKPDRNLTVLCGHTHGSGESQILPNVQVITGGAEYGAPRVQRVFDLDAV